LVAQEGRNLQAHQPGRAPLLPGVGPPRPAAVPWLDRGYRQTGVTRKPV